MIHRITLTIALLTTAAAHAQIVQLPSLRSFSVRTSVLVPDSGGAYLGGVNRSSHWMASRGPGWGPLGRTRGRAGGMSSSGVMVTATIIDNHELDELVLEEARAIRAARGIELPDHSKPRIAVSVGSTPMSLAAIRRELAAEDAAVEREAQADFQRAQACDRAGEGALARNYYRVAAQKSKSDVKRKALERLARLAASGPKTR